MLFTLLVIVILTAFIFEYINGFHDTANAIATVVSTKVLSPRDAILFAAVLNFVGALSGTHVAKTIGSGMVETSVVTQGVILAALIGFVVGFGIMLALLWIFARSKPDKVNSLFRKMQLVSSAFMAFSHGSNDAQKTMGVGSTIRLSAVKWGVVGTIVKAWILTIPVCMGLSAITYMLIRYWAP
jgi:PiT family inorganic phosphate transporter